MDNNYYMEQAKVQANLMNQSAAKQESFFQQLLVVSAGILGILISLHTNNAASLYIRAVFVFSMVLLALGVLSLSIVVYDYSQLVERGRQAHLNELQKALRENKKVGHIGIGKKKRTKACEKLSYIFLPTALLLLVLYSILVAFC